MTDKKVLVRAYQHSLKSLGGATSDIRLSAMDSFGAITNTVLNYNNSMLIGKYLGFLEYLHTAVSGKPPKTVLGLLERMITSEVAESAEKSKHETQPYEDKTYISMAEGIDALRENDKKNKTKQISDNGYRYRITSAINRKKLPSQKKDMKIQIPRKKFERFFDLM